MPDDDRYSVTELADLAGVTPRTVRYYLAQGLLPSVGHSGPGSKYDDGHLARLRLIRRLQAEHLPLAEIRRRLDELDDAQIRDLAGRSEASPPRDSALDYLRSVLSGQSRGPFAAPASPAAAPSIPPMRAAPSLLRRMSVGPTEMPARDGMLREDVGFDVDRPADRVAVEKTPAPPIERSQWERIVLAPDVELHIRRPLARAQNRQVDRLVTIARELLEEDRP